MGYKTRTVQRGTKTVNKRQYNSTTREYEVVAVEVPNYVDETYYDYSSDSGSSYDPGSSYSGE